MSHSKGTGAITKMGPGDSWWGFPTDLAVKPCCPSLHHSHRLQFAGEEWLVRRPYCQLGTARQLICKAQGMVGNQYMVQWRILSSPQKDLDIRA